MAALLILNYDVTDPEGLAAYRAAARPLLAARGRRIASTADTVDLGEGGPAGTHTVVWRFPSTAAARAVYDSAAYRSALGDRLGSTTARMAVIVATEDD